MSGMLERDAGLRAQMRALTPARVGLGRTGVSQQTADLLDFQRAHAMARDAVHARMNGEALAAELEGISGAAVLRLKTAAGDRATYLQRPDLGRRLDAVSLARLRPGVWDVAVVVADGLSAIAVERHAAALVKELLPRLEGWKLAPLVVVEQGRVAVGDVIGETLGAKLSVVLIGERPGLSSPDSLGAYITWQPRVGRTDAERNCISNIRAEGLSYERAAAQLVFYLTAARQRQLTGIPLKDGSGALGAG